MKNLKRLIASLTLLSALTMTGCASRQVDKPQNGSGVDGNGMSLKVGVMPAVDSAPIFLAAKKGYFKEFGVNVEVQQYTNAMNRQSALQSGELDGAMTDVIALVNNVQNGFDIKVTTSTDGSFPFLVKKDFKETKDIKVGMMEISVTNYLSEEALRDKYNIQKVYINEIPARLEMIKQGQLDMAVIPEPMASNGELSGLEKKVFAVKDDFSPDVMVFIGKAIKDKEKAVKAFHDAYNKAIVDIQKNDKEAREVLIEQLKLNEAIKDKIILPRYNKARVPSKEYLTKIMNWNEKTLGKKIDLKYEALVEGKFVK
jgi:NitT/TauT family transport system substrate-binding protein